MHVTSSREGGQKVDQLTHRHIDKIISINSLRILHAGMQFGTFII